MFRRSIVLIATFGALALAPSIASAAVYVSPSGNDSNDCTSAASPCLTISEAVDKAGSPDTVNIAAGTYTGGANRGVSFNKQLTFQGADKATTILDGDGIEFLLWSKDDAIEVRDLTLRNAAKGSAPEGAAVIAWDNVNFDYYDVSVENVAITDSESIGGSGSAIFGAEVTVSGSSNFKDNLSDDSGGAIYSVSDVTVSGSATFDGNYAGGSGGAIYTSDRVLITGSATFEDNEADDYGGAIYADEVLIDPGSGQVATFTNNLSGDNGGAIYAETYAAVDNSTFTGNPDPAGFSAGDDGGAIYVDDDEEGFDLVATNSTFTGFRIEGYYGGALSAYDGDAYLENVTVTDSYSGEYGGGLYADEDATIIGSTFERNDTDCCEGGGAYVEAFATVEDSVFRDNKADGGQDWGGGLFADGGAIITGSTFIGNEGEDGAGAYIDSDADIFDSTFEDNTAGDEAGGLRISGVAQITNSTFEDNTAGGDGAGVRMNAGTVSGSTFSGNEITGAGLGAALYMSNGPENVVENSTFTGNSGPSVIYTDNAEDPAIALELNNVTVAGNTLTDLDYAAIEVADDGSATADLEVNNSIIAQDDGSGGEAPGCATPNTISSNGGNVVQNTTTGCDDLVGGPPAPATPVSAAQIGLEPLALNAPGSTRTMAIGAASVASNAGVPASCLPADQRGVSRPADSCSSGAYQYLAGFALTVTRDGTGSGTVTSTPAGIDCGSTCEADFAAFSTVTLAASAASGSTFTGWSGSECSGTGNCEVTMSEARSVTATFTADSPPPPPPSGKPKLKLSVKTPKKVKAGKSFRVTVRTSNVAKDEPTVTARVNGGSSPTTARDVKTCARLPKGLFVVKKGGGKVKGQTICWTRSSLSAGKSVTYKPTVRSSRTKSGSVRVSGTASASNSSGATVKASGSTKVRIVKPKAPKPKPPTG